MTEERAIEIIKDEVDHIKHHLKEKGKAAEFYIELGDLVCAFEMGVKALEQKPKWIPVSERLPEDRNTVLVTAYWHETYQVMQAVYFGNDEWRCVPFNNTGEHLQKLKPKAWMPLPAVYKCDVQMTSSEAIQILNHIIEVAEKSDCGIKEIDGFDEDAILMGIKALKQYGVLSVIREEVRKQNIADFIAVQMVLEIIDRCVEEYTK